MTKLVRRPGLRPRLLVDFSAKDLLSYLGGSPVIDHGRDWPAAGYNACLLTSGRAGLYLLLRSLGLRPQSRIGVPLFVCEAVFEAVVRAGHQPVFLDVDPATMILSTTSLSNGHSIDAIIAVHLFGNPVDIQSLSNEDRLPVIEDCAHAIFSEVHGSAVGTMGVGTLYSFGLGKPISIGRLGAAVIPERTVSDEFSSSLGLMPQESRSASVYRGLRSFAISTLYRSPWYGMFSYELGRMFEESINPMSHEIDDYELSQARLLSLVRSKRRAYQETLPLQRETWVALADALADGAPDDMVPQATQRGGVSDNWLFAIRCKSASQRNQLASVLWKNGVDSIKMYDQVPQIARTRYGYAGGAPDAERLCQTVLALLVRTPETTAHSSLESILFESVKALR